MDATQTMPTLFLCHSSPMLINNAEMGKEFRACADQIPTPRAILIFSAHWETDRLSFGETVTHDNLVYDFYGFPDDLYQTQYPAPGAPWLAQRVNQLYPDLKIETKDRGLDHGVWVPLLHMWPEANIPILQMTMPQNMSDQELYQLGVSLRPIRDEGVLIIGGGAITHNLREIMRGNHQSVPDWVSDFEEWVVNASRNNRANLVNWESDAPFARMNHPTPEHFRPLLVAAGAAHDDDSATIPIQGYEMGLFSRRSIQFG